MGFGICGVCDMVLLWVKVAIFGGMGVGWCGGYVGGFLGCFGRYGSDGLVLLIDYFGVLVGFYFGLFEVLGLTCFEG